MSLSSRTLSRALVMPTETIAPWRFTGGVFEADGSVVAESLLTREEEGDIVRADVPQAPSLVLTGEYIFGGYILRHFGHFILESCNRLWYAKQHPELPVVWADKGGLPAYARDILEIVGLSNPQVFIQEPTELERLHIPQASSHIGDFFAPELIEMLGQIDASPAAGRKTWLSRSALGRKLGGKVLGEGRLEQRLNQAGWDIFHPEDHSVREQLATYAASEEVAGFAGSAFHALLLLKGYSGKVTIFERGRPIDPAFSRVAAIKKLRQRVVTVPMRWIRGGMSRGIYSMPNSTAVLNTLELPVRQYAVPNRTRHSVRRIGALAKAIDAGSYLEVGVESGSTFLNVEILRKTAVDPVFQFDVRPFESKTIRFFEIPSDEYFVHADSNEKFDVIFLDGLHQFEQTFRDFCNALAVARPYAPIILDDTLPSDVHSMLRQQRKALQARQAAGGKGREWHGDVFKTVFAIHDFFPMLSYVTLNSGGNPQTIVWREARRAFQPRFDSLKAITDLTWDDLQANLDVLNLVDEAQGLFRAIGALRRIRAEESRRVMLSTSGPLGG